MASRLIALLGSIMFRKGIVCLDKVQGWAMGRRPVLGRTSSRDLGRICYTHDSCFIKHSRPDLAVNCGRKLAEYEAGPRVFSIYQWAGNLRQVLFGTGGTHFMTVDTSQPKQKRGREVNGTL